TTSDAPTVLPAAGNRDVGPREDVVVAVSLQRCGGKGETLNHTLDRGGVTASAQKRAISTRGGPPRRGRPWQRPRWSYSPRVAEARPGSNPRRTPRLQSPVSPRSCCWRSLMSNRVPRPMDLVSGSAWCGGAPHVTRVG